MDTLKSKKGSPVEHDGELMPVEDFNGTEYVWVEHLDNEAWEPKYIRWIKTELVALEADDTTLTLKPGGEPQYKSSFGRHIMVDGELVLKPYHFRRAKMSDKDSISAYAPPTAADVSPAAGACCGG